MKRFLTEFSSLKPRARPNSSRPTARVRRARKPQKSRKIEAEKPAGGRYTAQAPFVLVEKFFEIRSTNTRFVWPRFSRSRFLPRLGANAANARRTPATL